MIWGFGIHLAPHFASIRVETRQMNNADLVRDKTERRAKHTQSVFDAPLEINRRCLLKVLCWAGDFPDLESEHHRLGDHLVVKNKIIRVFQNREGLEKLT